MEISEPPAKRRKTTPRVGHRPFTRASLARTQQDDSTLPAYTYRSLKKEDEIRIFKVEKIGPSEWQYDIEHTTLTGAPPFETVSYVWGPDTRRNILRLRDDRTIRINDNLAKALPYLAAECKTGYLWIDQINIDQSSTQERNHQVKMMGDIYCRGERVLAWLGIGPKLNKSTLALVEMVRYSLEVRKCNYDIRVSIERQIHENGLGDIVAILQLLKSEWFSRAWVFQEIVLPNHALFLLGDLNLPFLVLFLICRTAMLAPSESNSETQLRCPSSFAILPRMPVQDVALIRRYQSLYIMHRRWWAEHNSWGSIGGTIPFTWLLSTVSPLLQTTDLKDSVYAFLGLQPLRDGSKSMEPDYDAPYEQTLVRAATSIIRDSLSLDILAYCDREKSDERLLKPLPSWVPEWKATIKTPLLIRSPTGFHRASQGHSWLDSENPLELRVRVIRIDTISTVFAPGFSYQSANWREEDLERYLALDERLIEIQKHVPCCSRERLLSVILTQEHRPDFAHEDYHDQEYNHSVEEHLETYDEYIREGREMGPASGTHILDELRNQTYLVNTKHLFLTEDGSLGCVKQPLRGDEICSIKGCPGIVVLRPCGGNRFTVVGICSVEDRSWDIHPDVGTQQGFLYTIWKCFEGGEYTLV